jgi:hypothetical protein
MKDKTKKYFPKEINIRKAYVQIYDSTKNGFL